LLKAVAILPFQNAEGDPDLDYLSLSLADELATSLSYSRGLAIRPFSETRRYSRADLDLRKVADETNSSAVVAGHFLKEGNQLQLTLEAIDAKGGRVLWRDTLEAPGNALIELRQKIIARAQGPLTAALGGSAFTAEGTRPSNEEAYKLYLRAAAIPNDSHADTGAIALLEKSVGLDANFAPAWIDLGRRYYTVGRNGDGDESMMERSGSAVNRALALDPKNISAGASIPGWYIEAGDLLTGFTLCGTFSPSASGCLGGALHAELRTPLWRFAEAGGRAV
jgi:TolB-like protein